MSLNSAEKQRNNSGYRLKNNRKSPDLTGINRRDVCLMVFIWEPYMNVGTVVRVLAESAHIIQYLLTGIILVATFLIL